MKKALCGLFVVCALTLCGAANLVSQFEALAIGVLNVLKLEQIPDRTGAVGGPAKFKITRQTINHLEKLMKEGKTLVANPDGSVVVLEPGKQSLPPNP
jgi:hypothetical protein